ncbi:TetR/AcrR family transcriptional regulator [Amycolatopsis sp. lyj-112]|uniref:TetR/AcrR family transcriptional regulator n=1 Tax=Amycolatopsis sp. lyj-112 TaxID=2789288 RepID=UPI00397B7F65
MSGRRPYAARMPAEQRRAQLLDTALRIIADDGYRAVSIDRIAREVDVTRPVVYNAFDGLDALLTALLERQEQRAVEQLLATISTEVDLLDPAAHLKSTITALATMVTADPLTWKPIFLISVEAPAIVRDRIDRNRDVVRERIQTLVEATLTGRRGTAEVDPAVVAHSLIAIGEYFGRLLLLDPDAVDVDGLATTVAALVGPMRRTARASGPVSSP